MVWVLLDNAVSTDLDITCQDSTFHCKPTHLMVPVGSSSSQMEEIQVVSVVIAIICAVICCSASHSTNFFGFLATTCRNQGTSE